MTNRNFQQYPFIFAIRYVSRVWECWKIVQTRSCQVLLLWIDQYLNPHGWHTLRVNLLSQSFQFLGFLRFFRYIFVLVQKGIIHDYLVLILFRGEYWIFLCIGSYYFASLRIASTVLASSERVVSMLAIVVSTRTLSYPIDTSEDIRVTSLVFWCFISVGVDFFVKSIDPLRSTMIFCAVFLPIPGTLERSLSSSIWMACIRVSLPRPRSASAVFPPIPFTLFRSRKRCRSSVEINPNKSSLTSVLWWWIHTAIGFSLSRVPRTEGDTRISKPNPVPATFTVSVIPSMARMSHSIYQNIIAL